MSLAVTVACLAFERTVTNPQFAVSTNQNFVVESVELTDTATFLDCAYHGRRGSRFSIGAGSSLLVGGERIAIRRAEGIIPGKSVRIDTTGCSRFRLVFPPVAAGVESFDFVEGSYNGAFQIFGICLSDDCKPACERMPEAIRTAALRPVASDDTLPVPQWKLGKATVRGRLYGYRPEMKSKIELYPGMAIDPSLDNLITTEVSADGTFSLEVPMYATYQTVGVSLDGNSYHVVLRQGGTCEIYSDLVDNSHSHLSDGRSKAALGYGSRSDIYYFAGDMADVNNSLARPGVRKLMSGRRFTQLKSNIPAPDALYSPREFCAKAMQWHADNLKAADSICPSESAKTVVRAVLTYQTINGLMYRNRFVKADANGNPLMDDCIYDAYRKLNINDMTMAYSGSFDGVANCFQFILFEDTTYVNRMREIYSSASLSPADSLRQAERAYDRAFRARVFGWTDGPLFELMRANDFSTIFESETLLSDEQLRQLNGLPNTVIRDYYLARNEELKSTLAARKGNDKYTLHTAPGGSGEEALAAIGREFAGKVVLVDFWGTWCGPCRNAIKMFKESKERFEKQGVEFVYIPDEKSSEESWHNMASGIPGHHYRLTEAQTTDIFRKFGFTGWPSYIIMDKEWCPVYSRTGFRENEITNKLKSIIQ